MEHRVAIRQSTHEVKAFTHGRLDYRVQVIATKKQLSADETAVPLPHEEESIGPRREA